VSDSSVQHKRLGLIDSGDRECLRYLAAGWAVAEALTARLGSRILVSAAFRVHPICLKREAVIQIDRSQHSATRVAAAVHRSPTGSDNEPVCPLDWCEFGGTGAMGRDHSPQVMTATPGRRVRHGAELSSACWAKIHSNQNICSELTHGFRKESGEVRTMARRVIFLTDRIVNKIRRSSPSM
jgi:hypothetical protein